MSKWISTEDKLPPEGKYVIAKHNRGTWHDSTDQENVNTVIVKLVKGISLEERIPLVSAGMQRGYLYKASDEFGNNQKPYCWEEFGPDSFFGQDITHWIPIPKLS